MIDWTPAGAVGAGTAEPLHYLRSASGSVVALTNAAGQAVERYAYDPYGRTNIFDAVGVWKGFSPYGNPFLWTGQRYDASTTLYHFWARSYSPWSGRWLQRDPLGYVDGVNLYEYVLSDPVDLVDPDGQSPFSWICKKAGKKALKSRVKDWIKDKVKDRLKNLATRKEAKELLDEADEILGLMEDEWWEIGIELVPVAGDIYGFGKFAKRTQRVFERLDELEHKVGRYIDNLRRRGVDRAWARELDRIRQTGRGSRDWSPHELKEIQERGRVTGYVGHHEKPVKDYPELADDPDNVAIIPDPEHKARHYGS